MQSYLTFTLQVHYSNVLTVLGLTVSGTRAIGGVPGGLAGLDHLGVGIVLLVITVLSSDSTDLKNKDIN